MIKYVVSWICRAFVTYILQVCEFSTMLYWHKWFNHEAYYVKRSTGQGFAKMEPEGKEYLKLNYNFNSTTLLSIKSGTPSRWT